MDTKSNDDSAGSDSLDKSMQQKCVMVETTTTSTATTSLAKTLESQAGTAADGLGVERSKETELATNSQQLEAEQKTDTCDTESSVSESSTTLESKIGDDGSGNDSINKIPMASSSSPATAFETKVTQISQNLEQTTLAETSATTNDVTDAANDSGGNEGDNNDPRIKRVRFHPNVKVNDGGKRLQKKRRIAKSSVGGSLSATGDPSNCDGMDLDEDDEEDDEQEEQFDLAKTIAEAEDYLKQHPFTFVRRVEENGERLRDGLLNIEDMPQLSDKESDDADEDFYKRIKPENGIERVLGKETKAGKVEFLLRYENQGGLFWESEDFIRRMCPSLLRAYEKNRERRQQRLMYHVAKRQSLRQRYTDF